MWKPLVVLAILANTALITPSEATCGGDPNAVSGCGSNCGRLCSNYKKKNVTCTLICKLNGCDCRKGFVFDSNLNKCVLPEDCTKVCGLNEVYDTCANGGCQKRNCSQVGEPTICIDPIKCIGGCVCQEGYLRNENGTCVPEAQCPLQCTKPHEVYDPCARSCPPQTCAAIGIAYPCPNPPEGEEFCQPACRCEDGYYRNSVDECISEADCQYDCAKNETLDSCFSGCPPRFCGVNIAAVSCLAINESDCEPGCRCSDGYLRNAEGNCVLESDCPRCTGPNEIYDICPMLCPPQRCDVDPSVIKCAAPPRPGDPECEPGCQCVDGYVRNTDGICIPRDQCPQNCKGKHEIYSQCPAFACRPLNCTQVGFPQPCPIPGPDPSRCPGKPGCICENGYARNSRGKCIPIKKCPECGGDPNAVAGCGINCGRLCSNYKHPENVSCITECRDNSCDCRKRFVLDENINKCVLPKDCTPQ